MSERIKNFKIFIKTFGIVFVLGLIMLFIKYVC